MLRTPLQARTLSSHFSLLPSLRPRPHSLSVRFSKISGSLLLSSTSFVPRAGSVDRLGISMGVGELPWSGGGGVGRRQSSWGSVGESFLLAPGFRFCGAEPSLSFPFLQLLSCKTPCPLMKKSHPNAAALRPQQPRSQVAPRVECTDGAPGTSAP